MKIKNMKPEELTPYETNPRVITDEQVAAVAKSIQEFGWRQPIVIDTENVIVIGHKRWQAAQLLELKKVPVHTAEGLTDEQIKALRLNDNKLSENSTWDQILLGLEVSGLEESGFDLDALAFSDAELKRLLAAGADFGPDLNPGVGGGATTADDILAAAGEQGKMGERSKQILVEVTCPECGSSFHLQPEDMRE